MGFNKYYDLAVSVGAVRIGADPSPIDLARTEGLSVATAYANTADHKRYIGWARLNPRPDIAPEDQTTIKHSDSSDDMESWLATVNGDPLVLWAGYYDTKIGKLVKETVGKVIEVKADSGGSGAGVVAGLLGAVGLLALVAKAK